MSGSPIPDQVDVRSQTRRQLRAYQVRSLNTFDGDAIVWNDVYEGIDLVAAAGAPGEVLDVRGYDSVLVLCELTTGQIDVDGTGGLDLVFESASEAVGPWYTRQTGFDTFYGNVASAGDPVVIENNNHRYRYLVPNGTVAGSVVNFAFEIKTTGHFMRVAPEAFLNAGAVTNSRLRIRAHRSLESE